MQNINSNIITSTEAQELFNKSLKISVIERNILFKLNQLIHSQSQSACNFLQVPWREIEIKNISMKRKLVIRRRIENKLKSLGYKIKKYDAVINQQHYEAKDIIVIEW